MNLIIKFIVVISTVFSFAKITFAEELIVWSRGGWSDWMVEGFQ